MNKVSRKNAEVVKIYKNWSLNLKERAHLRDYELMERRMKIENEDPSYILVVQERFQ
jgi:hypothetical protein